MGWGANALKVGKWVVVRKRLKTPAIYHPRNSQISNQLYIMILSIVLLTFCLTSFSQNYPKFFSILEDGFNLTFLKYFENYDVHYR